MIFITPIWMRRRDALQFAINETEMWPFSYLNPHGSWHEFCCRLFLYNEPWKIPFHVQWKLVPFFSLPFEAIKWRFNACLSHCADTSLPRIQNRLAVKVIKMNMQNILEEKKTLSPNQGITLMTSPRSFSPSKGHVSINSTLCINSVNKTPQFVPLAALTSLRRLAAANYKALVSDEAMRRVGFAAWRPPLPLPHPLNLQQKLLSMLMSSC